MDEVGSDHWETPDVIRLAVVNDQDRPMAVVLGLEPVNIARLEDGEPIRVNLRHLDPRGPEVPELPDLDIVIAATAHPAFDDFLEMLGQTLSLFRGDGE
jgi:hypothetical protein